MIKQHKVVSSNPIKPCIQGNKLNDGSQHIPPKLLDRVHLKISLYCHQLLLFHVFGKILHHICRNFFVSREIKSLGSDYSNMDDDPHTNMAQNPNNLNLP